jgi:predicted regulator of Ras-like GTPase activity (Roadblock/LC7/MglB family)
MTAFVSGQIDQVSRLDPSLAAFAEQTPGVAQAIVVTEDGMLMGVSADQDRADAERFAAITSAMASLAVGASRMYELGQMNKLVLDLDRAFLLIGAFGPGAWVGVIAHRNADLGDLARRIAAFVAEHASPLNNG